MIYTLTDRTAKRSWQYETESQLRTVTRLYAIQHPAASLAVNINGTVTVLR